MNPCWFALPPAALLLAWSSRGGWLRAGLWFALAILGQACSLVLYRAGPVVSYHHYRWPEDPARLWPSVIVIALQAVLVAWALARRASEVRGWIAQNFKTWQVVLLLGLVAVTSAKPSRPGSASALEFAFATFVELLGLATVLIGAVELPAPVLGRFRERWERVFGRPSAEGTPEPGGLDRFAWLAALWVTLVCALLASFVYQRHPHLPDEVGYLMHARYLAQGRLSLSPPPVPEAFDVDLMLRIGERWFCPVPPGWPLALAAGAFLGVPWLVNPVLSGVAILLTYLFVRELSDRRTARLAVVLLCASPWFLFLGMSFMTHTWTLVCALLAALGVARSRRAGRAWARTLWAWIAGAAIGMVSLIRPLEGLVLAALLGLWAIGLGGARLKLAGIAGLVLGTMAVAALAFPYGLELTGKAWPPPLNVYSDAVYGQGRNSLGFGSNRGLDFGGLDPWPGHTPVQALVNAQFNVFAIDAELFGWTTGSLLLVYLAFCWSRGKRPDRLLWAVIVAIVGSNSLYWFSGGPDFGARYWFLVLLPCVLLSLSGLGALQRRLGGEATRANLAISVLCLGALFTFLPWRATDKYRNYRGMRPEMRELMSEHDFGRSLVLVQGERHPDYASAAVYNPLRWDADAPILAWDRSPEVRAMVLEHYRDRPVWVVAGPTRTGRGFEVVEGPLTAAELLARKASPGDPGSLGK